MVLAITFAFNMGYALLAFIILMLFLAYLDRRIAKAKSSHFHQVIGRIQSNAIAEALYYGLRFAGVCLIASQFIRG